MTPIVAVSIAASTLAVLALRPSAACAVVLLISPVMRDGPSEVNSWTHKSILVGGLLVAFLVRRSTARPSIYAPRVALLAAFSLALALPSHWMSDHRALQLDATNALVVATLFLLLLLRMLDKGTLKAASNALAVLTFFVCLFGFVQYATIAFRITHPALVWTLPPDLRYQFIDHAAAIQTWGVRLPSVFYHSNQSGHFLVLVLGFFLPPMMAARRARTRLACGVLVTLILISTFLTQSRTALALALLEFVVVVLLTQPTWRAARNLALGGALSLGVAFTLFPINAKAFAHRLASFSLSYRDELWCRAASLVPDHLIVGTGPGGSSSEMLKRFPATDLQGMNDQLLVGHYDYWSSHPHNDVLASLIEIGLVATILRYALSFLVVMVGVRLIRTAGSRTHRILAMSATVPLGAEFLRTPVESYSFLSAPGCGVVVAFLMAVIVFVEARAPSTRRLTRPGDTMVGSSPAYVTSSSPPG